MCSACSELSSLKTRSTNGYCDHYNNQIPFIEQSEDLGDLDGVDDSDSEQKIKFRQTILARQLSGDPSKLNPQKALNSQASAITYNPKLEIDRSNFIVGKMLGSGYFGSVYEGKCTFLYQPNYDSSVNR